MSADINVGAITEALNSKVDLVNGVPQDAVDYVVAMQRPTADNNYTWYRKYKSGWVEQGGKISQSVTSITMPVEMKDGNYDCFVTYYKSTTNETAALNKYCTATQTTAGFTVTSSTIERIWQVSGMAA
jgi:hypothetical protein